MVKENNTKWPLVSLLSTEFIERIVEEAKDALLRIEMGNTSLTFCSLLRK